MELERARSRSSTERGQVQQLLAEIGKARTDDHEAERDATYPAQPLAQQGVDDAVAAGLRNRLAALGRALQRVEDGSYGRSIRLACCCANFPLRQRRSGQHLSARSPCFGPIEGGRRLSHDVIATRHPGLRVIAQDVWTMRGGRYRADPSGL